MRAPPPEPPLSFGERIKNAIRMNYRGIFGVLVPLCLLTWQVKDRFDQAGIVKCTWLWVAWTLFLQPVHLPMAGLIPVFMLPMCGIIDSSKLCFLYFNESIAVFLLGTMINMLLNNSGFDRRMELKILRSGDNNSYHPRKLVLKAATAAFVMSMFSNRLMVTNDVITFLAPTLLDLKASPDADFESVRAIICTAIHVGSAIGCCVFPHGSMCILFMRMQFYESAKPTNEYPDVFNYMQYIIYSFPVALIMFVLSSLFFMALIGGKKLSPSSLGTIGGALNKHQAALPKDITNHEKMTIVFYAAFLLLCITRWCKFMDMGWTTFAKDKTYPLIPRIRDAVVCAIFVLVLFSLPKGTNFLKYFTAKKYKDLPAKRPESGVLFWRFVDKNVQYGYIFLFGAGVSIANACTKSGPGGAPLQDTITNDVGKIVTDHHWNVSIFIVCFVAVFLANIMPGIAACVVWTPFVVNMARDGAPRNWDQKVYLGLLGAGFGSSLGFMCPFLHTPAYFTNSVGKIKKVKMAKVAIGAVVICFIILWLSLIIYAPLLWDPNDDGGFVTIPGPDTTTAKKGEAGAAAPEAPGAGPPAPPPPPPPAADP